MNIPKALIVPCEGLALTSGERQLFKDQNPFGLILFARNIHAPEQVAALTAEFRACVGRDDAPVLIDQEGGRVARLKPPHWHELPPAEKIGQLYLQDSQAGLDAAYLLGRLLASQLAPLGITVDCAPVLDLLVAGADSVIGNRSFGPDPQVVSVLGRAVCNGLRAGGVLPVIKHIPGHGRATADSHLELPHLETPVDVLAASDFIPFANLADIPLAMTAHVLYREIDAEACATLSPKVINGVIRQRLGFDGLLMSDDICMQALEGKLPDLARGILAAGCDLALICQNSSRDQPDLAVLDSVLEATPALTAQAQRRWEKAKDWLTLQPPAESTCESVFEPDLAARQLAHLLENVNI